MASRVGLLTITLGEAAFTARAQAGATQTLAWLAQRLPLEGLARHARWSGEAAWAPLGAPPGLAPENATTYPAPGALLIYPGGVSEPEILLPYGACAFASRAGALAGNHFATIEGDLAELRRVGEALLMTGAVPLRITSAQR